MITKTQKVPQYQGNSFKQFNEDYQNLTKNLGSKFRHTLQPLPLDSQESVTSNASRAGSTWDSKHMDKFVQSSPWATQTQTATSSMGIGQIKRGKTGDGTRVSRYVNDDNFKMIDYPDQYCDKNFLVSDRVDLNDKYYSQNFNVNRQAQNTAIELSMCFQKSSLMNPQEKRQQLKEIKQQQKEFQQWKQQYNTMNKKYRVHTKGFTSGILSVDNPCNEHSQLYSEAAQKEAQRRQRKQQFRTLHQDNLSQLARTNPQIEFLNNFSKQYEPINQIPLAVNNSSYRFQHQYDVNDKVKKNETNIPEQLAVSIINEPFDHSHRERLLPGWDCKRPVTTNLLSQGKDTGDRLFGAEAKNFSIVRAKYLREQETKKRDFNVISFVDNSIEFKQDQGIHSMYKQAHQPKSISQQQQQIKQQEVKQ